MGSSMMSGVVVRSVLAKALISGRWLAIRMAIKLNFIFNYLIGIGKL